MKSNKFFIDKENTRNFTDFKKLNVVPYLIFISSGVSIHPSEWQTLLAEEQLQTLLQLFPTKVLGHVSEQSAPWVPSGHSMSSTKWQALDKLSIE